MKNIILFLTMSFFLTPSFAAAPSPSGGWGPPTVTRVALTDVIEATARQQAIRNGTAVTLEAVVQETINRQAVGKVLLKRLLAGGLLIGATQSLLDGIGWVMEDGVYVKYKIPDENPKDVQKTWCFQNASSKYYCSKSALSLKNIYKSQYPQYPAEYEWRALNPDAWYLVLREKKESTSGGVSVTFLYIKNPYYDPNAQPPKPQKITLTSDLLGDLAVGDYTDPVDPSADKKDKVWTDVENSYKPDVTGNDLNDKINNKLDNAPETNNKPSTSPKPDGDGQKYPAPDEKPGGQGETENTTDPETGNQAGNFTLPDWCLWAADQCQWHKEDKKHQEEETSFWDSTKTFFKSVTDFFDWTKDDKDDGDQEEQQPDTSSLDKKFDTTFNASGTCPPNPRIEFPLVGAVELPFTKICDFFSFLRFGVLTGASLLACWIVSAAVRGGES